MNSKKRFNMANTIMLIMLKVMLKMMKKGIIPNKTMPLPIFITPIKFQPNEPKSDLMLERKKIMYNCGICKHKFMMKSDTILTQNTVMQWIKEVKDHKCDDYKKDMA